MAHGNVLVISGKADWEKQHSEAAGKVVSATSSPNCCIDGAKDCPFRTDDCVSGGRVHFWRNAGTGVAAIT